MSFNSGIKTNVVAAAARTNRFEFIDRADALSGDDAMSKCEWAKFWGKACGGWMIF